jgi:hypothetical protein
MPCTVIDQILEFLTGLEVGDALGGHFNFFAGFRVSADPSIPLPDSKTAEPPDFKLVTGRQRPDYTFEHRIDDDFGIFPRQFRNLGHFFNQVCLGHNLLLLFYRYFRKY